MTSHRHYQRSYPSLFRSGLFVSVRFHARFSVCDRLIDSLRPLPILIACSKHLTFSVGLENFWVIKSCYRCTNTRKGVFIRKYLENLKSPLIRSNVTHNPSTSRFCNFGSLLQHLLNALTSLQLFCRTKGLRPLSADSLGPPVRSPPFWGRANSEQSRFEASRFNSEVFKALRFSTIL